VIDDREHYKMLKYMYVAPIHIPTYLLGRGVAKFAFGTLSVLITLAFGVLFLNVPINPLTINWPLLIVGLLLGVTMLAFLGLILGSFTLIIANQVWFLGEAVAGALYIFSGAVFPLDVLPAWLQPIGYAMPLTYWLEIMRRAVVGSVAEAFPTLAQFSDLQLIGILAGLTLVFGLIAFVTFRWCDHRARELGYIDMTTNF
jgi:ABC-2 type transport system permease protein